MKNYSISEVAYLLPYGSNYKVVLCDAKGNDIAMIEDLDWGDMYEILHRDWWNNNTEISGMHISVERKTCIELALRKVG